MCDSTSLNILISSLKTFFTFSVISGPTKINNWFCLNTLFYTSPGFFFYSRKVNIEVWLTFFCECCFERKSYFYNISVFVSCCQCWDVCTTPLPLALIPAGWSVVNFQWRPTKVLQNNSSFLGSQCCQDMSGYTKQSCWCRLEPPKQEMEIKMDTTTLNH